MLQHPPKAIFTDNAPPIKKIFETLSQKYIFGCLK